MKTIYTSLSEAVNDLTQKGYTYNFNINKDIIECQSNNLKLQTDEFEVDGVFRFQEMSDVDNESILYSITATNLNMKGLLVNSYSVYSESVSPELVAKLHKR